MFKISCFILILVLSSLGFASEQDPTLELIRDLSNAPGSGNFEGPVRDILKRELEELQFSMQTDHLGNLLGFREMAAGKPRVLLMAHMDEVAFLIREITEEGFIVFDSIGNWVDPVVVGQKWVISTPKGPIKGITGMESSHVIVEYPKLPPISQKQLFLDIGVKSKEEAEALGIRPGLPITPDVAFEVMNNTERYCAKAFDDRLALAAIITALKNVSEKELPCEIVFAATVQEEFWMVGSQAVFASTHPEVVVNVEVGVARDFPVIFPNHLSHHPCLGKGPSIFVYDSSMLPSNGLVEYFIVLAQNNLIPFQYEAEGVNFSQDGCRLQGAGCGTHVINLGIPTRYIHAPYGIADRFDFDKMVELLVCFLQSFDDDALKHLAP